MATAESRRAPGGQRRPQWLDLGQVVWRRCTHQSAARTSVEDHYITSLSPAEASPERLLALSRGHRQIENNVHRAQDVVFGQDASTLRRGTAPEAMRVFRDAIMHLRHQRAGFLVSDKLRYFQSIPSRLSTCWACGDFDLALC